jgi:predicted nucleotidyltransferase
VRLAALAAPGWGAMLPLQPGGPKNHMPKFSGYPSPTATRRAAEARTARANERAAELAPIVKDIQAAGVMSLRGIARALNERGISPPRGHGWRATQVRRLLARLPELSGTSMNMRDEWISGLRVWASRTDSVRELWLFGSRARGDARADSDVDLAVVLMPPNGKHDWAGGNYIACHSAWKAELETIVGRHVSLEAIEPGSDEEAMVRCTGRRLWSRD